MSTALAHSDRLTCDRTCAVAARFPAHHDRLLAIDTDVDVLLELIEIAVTWHELDYSESDLIGPDDWLDLAETHHWRYPERAHRALSLAVDIAGRRPSGSGSQVHLADVIELVRR